MSVAHAVGFKQQLAGFSILEIFGTKARAFRNSCQHTGANFFAIVEGEDNIWPTFSGHRTVGSGLPLDLPADPKQTRHLVAFVLDQSLMRP